MLKCELCNKCFDNKSKYQSHKDNQSRCGVIVPEYRFDFVCDKCGKTFACKRNLTEHLENKNGKCFKRHLQQQQVFKRLQELEQRMDNIKPIINNNFNINNLFVRHGRETITHITKEDILKLLSYKSFVYMATDIIKLLYFSRKNPRNANWTIAYPKDEKAGVTFNYDTELFERVPTEILINDKFGNAFDLLQPLIEEILKEDEENNILTQQQRINISKFYHFFGSYEISKDNKDIYDSIHNMAYNFRSIPMNQWKEQGFSGNHMSIKF
jgi:hypothetical protein